MINVDGASTEYNFKKSLFPVDLMDTWKFFFLSIQGWCKVMW